VVPASPSAASTAPVRSRRPLAIGSRLSGTCLVAAQATKMPIGRLMKKIARQEMAPIR
jgi:hypothetical protein